MNQSKSASPARASAMLPHHPWEYETTGSHAATYFCTPRTCRYYESEGNYSIPVWGSLKFSSADGERLHVRRSLCQQFCFLRPRGLSRVPCFITTQSSILSIRKSLSISSMMEVLVQDLCKPDVVAAIAKQR